MPPQSRYPTPANTFGIAKKPLEQWFDATTSGYERTGPAFSNEIEDSLIRNDQRALEQEKLRRQLESEAAASDFMSKAAGQNPQGLMRMIADDPAILGSEGFNQIRDFVEMRQKMEPPPVVEQPFSNKSLAPAIMSKLPPEDQFRMQKLTDQGMPAYDAYETILQERQNLSTQQQLRQAGLKLLEEGADEAEVAAALESEEPDVAFARIKGKMARGAATGKVTDGGDVDPLKQADQLFKLIESAEMSGASPKVVETLKKRLEDLFIETPPPPAATDKANLSTGAGGAATDTTKTTPPAPTAATDTGLTAAQLAARDMPLSESERRDATIKAEAEFVKQQEEKERMSQWTSVKDAITEDFSNDPVAFLNEAKDAVMGVSAKNEAAQRVANFALAQSVGRKVNMGVRQEPRGDGTSQAVPILISPAEALVMELGLKPTDIVGTITEPNGRKREVTALEAAEARLNEVLIPLREQQKKAKVEQRQAELTPKVAKGLEKIQGQVNTSK
jgi:hypothetical protein